MEQDPQEKMSLTYTFFLLVVRFFTHARSETLIHGVKLPSLWASSFCAAKAFRVTWSKRKCLPRMRHRNELTDTDWENAVEGLDKVLSTILEAGKNWNFGSGPGRGEGRRVKGRERKNAFRQSL